MTRAFAVNAVVWWRGSEEQRGAATVSRVPPTGQPPMPSARQSYRGALRSYMEWKGRDWMGELIGAFSGGGNSPISLVSDDMMGNTC